MVLKSGKTAYRQQMVSEKRHQRIGVGETYKDRHDYEKKRAMVEAGGAGFLGKIRDFFLGPKMPNVHEFAPNASYVDNAKTITQYHKGLEQGIKSDGPATDTELIAILNQIEKASASK